MPDTAVGERTLVPYERTSDVTKGDIVRLKDGERTSEYDGAPINPALRDVDVVVHNRDTSDSTVLIAVGDPVTFRHWVKVHQIVQVVSSPAAPVSAVEWVPVDEAEPPLKRGDVVRAKEDQRRVPNPHWGDLVDQLGTGFTATVTEVLDGSRFVARSEQTTGTYTYHPSQFEVQRPASEPASTVEVWESIGGHEDANFGDVVRFRADATDTGYDDDIELEWHGREMTIVEIDNGDDTLRVRTVEPDQTFRGDSRRIWVRVRSLERRTTVAASPLDPHDPASYQPGTEWKMVESETRWWTVKLREDGSAAEHYQGSEYANATLPAETIRERLAGGTRYTLTLTKGGLKDAAAKAPETPKPELYTEEWFNGFMDRALKYANRHDMCGEVERFLESEGIDHRKASAKTIVVKVNVEVEIEVDLSGRRAYDESDLTYHARQRVEGAVRGMDLSTITDATGEHVDAVRIGTPTVATEAKVK